MPGMMVAVLSVPNVGDVAGSIRGFGSAAGSRPRSGPVAGRRPPAWSVPVPLDDRVGRGASRTM